MSFEVSGYEHNRPDAVRIPFQMQGLYWSYAVWKSSIYTCPACFDALPFDLVPEFRVILVEQFAIIENHLTIIQLLTKLPNQNFSLYGRGTSGENTVIKQYWPEAYGTYLNQTLGSWGFESLTISIYFFFKYLFFIYLFACFFLVLWINWYFRCEYDMRLRNIHPWKNLGENEYISD